MAPFFRCESIQDSLFARMASFALSRQLFGYAILGFALSEAMALFALLVAFLILFVLLSFDRVLRRGWPGVGPGLVLGALHLRRVHPCAARGRARLAVAHSGSHPKWLFGQVSSPAWCRRPPSLRVLTGSAMPIFLRLAFI